MRSCSPGTRSSVLTITTVLTLPSAPLIADDRVALDIYQDSVAVGNYS